ncbi:MAG: hypothetical protein RR882_11075, partial [Comamonas sp.]
MKPLTTLAGLTLSLLMGLSTAWAQPADLLQNARNGDAAAQTTLGSVYAQGKGVATNPVEAVKW